MKLFVDDRNSATTTSNDPTDQYLCHLGIDVAWKKKGRPGTTTAPATRKAIGQRRFSTTTSTKCMGFFVIYVVSMNNIYLGQKNVSFYKIMLAMMDNEQHQINKNADFAKGETTIGNGLLVEPELRSFPRWGTSISKENKIDEVFTLERL